MRKFNKTLSLFSVALLAMVISCSKERIKPKTPLNTYNSPKSYLDSKKEEDQEFIVDSTGSGPIVGKKGTKIWTAKECLMYPNGDSVSYPFTVNLVELYTPKEMIYYQMPTVASGKILETDGEVRILAYKGDSMLQLRPDPCFTKVEIPNPSPETYMKAYYGFNVSDWINSPSTNFDKVSEGYSANIVRLGWINCGADVSNSSSSKITFTSEVDDLNNVAMFIYIPDNKTVMMVKGGFTSDPIPNGKNVKVVLIALNSSGKLFSYTENFGLKSNKEV